ncbi:T9SS type A sorting domain-containing protein [uncultured Winogradskyella sp.]|uniref:T9SS type A sorting domain-containing protein n=1 Tax=uncultured Winogradskyella sp. TaxID=395353 RepID=UPI0030DB7FF2|tara:strand:+ start:97 stop:600 length:504 start_codon:yes stop_codon:yes gene_type:complete
MQQRQTAMKKTQHNILLLVLVLCASLAKGQSAVTASGGDAIGNGGSMAYSLGQVVDQTYFTNAFSLAQGVQQVYTISTLNIATPDLKGLLTAYPNPTTHSITLNLKEFDAQNWSYELVDLQGRLLKTGATADGQTRINMSKNLPATYLLIIRDQNKTRVQTFKIIKQ